MTVKLRLLGLALLYAIVTGATAKTPDVRIIIVVNAANSVSTMKREHLAKIFLRQIETWNDGQEILPVDQIDRSPARAAFARRIEGQSVSALRRYWQERIFTGNESPPPERVTDADVLTYVRSNAGAIGYVTEGVELGTGVKEITITE